MEKKYALQLGQILTQKSLLTHEQLSAALLEQKKTNEPLGVILIRHGFLTDQMLLVALSEQQSIERVQLADREIPPAVIAKISVRIAVHYHLIPIEADEHSVLVASSEILSIHQLDDLKLMLNKEVKYVLASYEDISDAISKYYGVGAGTIDSMPASEIFEPTVSIQALETQNIANSGEDASIVKFVNEVLLEACKERATDIHIEPFEGDIRIRYRVDGVLYDTKVPPALKSFQAAITARIKIMSNLDVSDTRLPQDGRIKAKIGGQELDMRVAILPTPYGESVAIRLLSGNVFFGLEDLGLSPADVKTLDQIIHKPHGIFFVTGPTGSGKSTTLYAAINRLSRKDRKIITVEDPIEYQLRGVTQVQVHPKITLTFAQALRSMLRHDPDVLMVGEVRDYETAEITIRAALTGHMVFSTLHTNNAAGGVTRLIDMGIEPFLVVSSVECFMAQRLVRVLCPKCKIKYHPSAETLRRFNLPESQQKIELFTLKGCEFCKHTGYKGRTAIYEILVLNEPIKELILRRASLDEIHREAVKFRMKTLRQDGLEKALAGITTVEEVLRVTELH